MRRGKSEGGGALIAFSSLLIIIPFFIIQSQAAARSLLLESKYCSSSCGDIQNITYPFRLKGDPIICGDPDYELSCEKNKTIMNFHSGMYYVKNISYAMRTIRLVDVNFTNGTCNLPSASLSSDDVHNDYRYQGLLFFSSISFVNCSATINDPTYIILPCLSRGNTSYVYVKFDSESLHDVPVGCSYLSMTVVDRDDVKKYPSYDAIFKLLESGFVLGWSVECRNCHLSNRRCYISAYQYPLDYNCSKDNMVLAVLKILFPVLITLFMVIALIARFIITPLVVIVFLIHKYRKERKPVDRVENFLRNQQSLMPKRYSYNDLMAMTNHFKDQLGKGGFGSVYKGHLPGGFLIAVKMLENTKFSAQEFINEVSTIGRIHHVNVVQLLGFCSEGSYRGLVYEYMPNGSLDKHIFSKEGKAQSFTWEKLLEIALGTARGIEYLHCGCDVCILHFDIKPHNVLLDQNFVPKVADFGLAKFYPKEYNAMSMSTTRGTIGYIAPELISRNFGAVSSKSDVYSFGMLLLEMAGGRKNVDAKAKSSSKVYFPSWVYDHLTVGGGDLELVNVSEIEIEIAKKLCIVGLWCIQVKASDRPSMIRVVEMLEGSIDDLQMPPKPFWSSPQRLSVQETQSNASTGWQTSESMEECLYGDNNNVYSHQSIV
ncbi:hypothetical protein ACSBR2_006056 [Camellia fascicularis]